MSSFECEDNFDAQGVSKGRKPRIDTDTHGLIFGPLKSVFISVHPWFHVLDLWVSKIVSNKDYHKKKHASQKQACF